MVIVKTRWILNISCFLFLFNWNFSFCASKTFKIAFLAPSSPKSYHINAESSVNGVKLALRSVLKNPKILNGHKIAVKFFDTKCNAQSAVTTAMLAKTSFNPDVIVGPPCQEGLKMVAQLGTYWNLPVLNWYHTGNEFNSAKKYPTLVQMIPPVHLLSKVLAHQLTQHNVSQVSMLYTDRPPWSLLEDPVREATASAGVEIHGVYKVTSNMSTIALKRMFAHIGRVANAVIMACPFKDVRHLMLTATSVGMTNGKYTFFHLDPEIYTDVALSQEVLSSGGWKRGDAQDTEAREAYKSIIHIIIDPMTEKAGRPILYPRNNYMDYARLALNEARFRQPDWDLPPGLIPDVYSAYLCDAVVVWSVLVDLLNKQKKDYRDGKMLTTYMRRITADGATGNIALSQNLDRVGEVFVLKMQHDGIFKPVQFYKFDKDDRYSVLNIDPANHHVTQEARPVVGQMSHTELGKRNLQSKERAELTTTVTTSPTTTTTTTSTTTTTTVPSIKTTTTPTPTTTTTTKTAPSTTTSTPISTTMSSTSKMTRWTTKPDIQTVETKKTNANYVESNGPSKNTGRVQTKRKGNIRIEPHLDNFEIRLKKKRRIFAKAQKLLDGIRQTGDPNVAAFLQLALERLNAEEDLVARVPNEGRKKSVRKANIKKSKSKENIIRQKVQTPSKATVRSIAISETSTIASTVETTSALPKSTVVVIPNANIATASKFQNSVSPTTQESTAKPSTKIQVVNFTTIPPTTFFYEETTTQQPTTTTATTTIATTRRNRRRKNRRRKKGKLKMPKRRLRQKWFQENIKTTTPLPTKDPGEAPEIEVLMTDNMITSLVNRVTEQLMGKMTGEIKTLKNSINSIKSTIIKKKPKTRRTVGKTGTSLSPATMKPTLPTDINRSLIDEISSNVLTKLSGVSWLEQKPITVKTTKRFVKPSRPITNFFSRTSPLMPKTVTQLMARPTKPVPIPAAKTTRKPVPPRIVGSWMSGLPPALSMQLFAVESVPTTKEKIVRSNSKSVKMNPMNKSNGMQKLSTPTVIRSRKKNALSTQDNPLHVNTIVPLPTKTNVEGISKTVTVPEKKVLFQDIKTYSTKAQRNGVFPSQQTVKDSSLSRTENRSSPGQSQSGSGINVDSLIAKISQSVLGEVNKKIESLKLSVGGQVKTTRQPAVEKTVISPGQKFQSTATVLRSKPIGSNKLSIKTKTAIIKQISEAVIKQLSSQVKAKTELTTRVPITFPSQEHEPEGQTTSASIENGGSSGSLVDKISSKVFGKMNAKLDALSNTVNNLKHTLSRQELEEIPPELFGGRGNHMINGPSPMGQNFDKMSMPEIPNMPPIGMFGMPDSNPQSLRNSFSHGSSQSNPIPGTQSSSTANKNHGNQPTFQQNNDRSNIAKPPWTSGMNPWMNMRMPNQYAMWGGASNTRSPWWE